MMLPSKTTQFILAAVSSLQQARALSGVTAGIEQVAETATVLGGDLFDTTTFKTCYITDAPSLTQSVLDCLNFDKNDQHFSGVNGVYMTAVKADGVCTWEPDGTDAINDLVNVIKDHKSKNQNFQVWGLFNADPNLQYVNYTKINECMEQTYQNVFDGLLMDVEGQNVDPFGNCTTGVANISDLKMKTASFLGNGACTNFDQHKNNHKYLGMCYDEAQCDVQHGQMVYQGGSVKKPHWHPVDKFVLSAQSGKWNTTIASKLGKFSGAMFDVYDPNTIS